jgi:hypothetical protein
LRGGREVVAPTAPNWTSATWTASRPPQPDAEGDGAGLDRDVERHLQLAPAERAFEHGGLDPMAQVLGSPVHELHGERDGARLLAAHRRREPHGLATIGSRVGHLAQKGIAINGPSYRLKDRLHAIDPGTTTSIATVA